MAHTTSTGLSQPRSTRFCQLPEEARERLDNRPEYDCSKLANDPGLLGSEEQRSESQRILPPVADPDCTGRQQVTRSTPSEESTNEGRTAHHDYKSPGAFPGLAYCDGSRGEGEPNEPALREPSRSSHRTDFFAPGPTDLRWTDILDEQPWLAPAIEPNVRLLVDGHAVVLDQSRVDQLRCIGNSVVALQAALAFRVLARRLLAHDSDD